MKYVALILMISSLAQADPLPKKVVFQLSCERTYLRIVAEYFNPKSLARMADTFAQSCAEMSTGEFKNAPAGMGCIAAITQLKKARPDLPSPDALFVKFCESIAEKN